MHRSAFTVHPGDYANIVQHANGRPKELVLQGNQVLQDTGLLMHYLSDTEGGSSGSPVFNNRWELIALHHASRHNAEKLTLQSGLPPSAFVNEGIKLSAIAADLERRAQPGDAQALTVLENFEGVDSLMGFFGGLGRKASGGADLERLTAVYSGENEDIDVGFWNIEWLTNRGDEVLGSVAGVVADLNMDIWVLAGATRGAAESIVTELREVQAPVRDRRFRRDIGRQRAASHLEHRDRQRQAPRVAWRRRRMVRRRHRAVRRSGPRVVARTRVRPQA